MSTIKVERTVQGWTVFVDEVAQSTFDDPEAAEQEAAWLALASGGIVVGGVLGQD